MPGICRARNFHFIIVQNLYPHGEAGCEIVRPITTLHEIEFDGRTATPEEQEILSRYVGWSPKKFPTPQAGSRMLPLVKPILPTAS